MMITQENLIRDTIGKMNADNEQHLIHEGQMAERSAVVQTLTPIENVLKVLKNVHHGDRWLSSATREEALDLFKPSKIPTVNAIVDVCDYTEYRELEECAADLVKKKVFRKKILDQLRENYRNQRIERWQSSQETHAMYPRTRFNETDLFQFCRNSGGTRVQCAHAVDAAEKVFQNKTYTLPIEPPFTDDFEIAVNNQY